MKYLLEPLLMVRRLREDAAANALVQQHRKVAEAEALLVQRKKESAEYAKWRVVREEELWQEVIGREVQLRNLDDLKLDLQILWTGQEERQEAVFAAEKALAEERVKLEEAQARYRQASRSREKLDTHKQIWRVAALQEMEYAAEIEMEDFKVRPPAAAL